MAVEISVKGRRRDRPKFAPLNYLIIFLIAFFASATYFSGFSALEKLAGLVGIHRNFVRTYESFTVSFGSLIAESERSNIKGVLNEMELEGKKRFEFVQQDADIVFDFALTPQEESESEIYTSHLVPVGHLYWVKGNVKNSDIEKKILIPQERNELISGLILSKYKNSQITKSSDIVADLKKNEKVFGIIDISQLSPQMKLLTLEGDYFLDDEQGGIRYSLITTKESDYPDFVAVILKNKMAQALSIPFDRNRLVKVNMTGVTALTRELGAKIDASGNPGYAAVKIADFLKDADLTHVSNEVSFVSGCTLVAGVRFCSKPEYIKNLEDIGTDIVELTGNHDNDYGAQYNTSSIKTYKKKGWDYFGGGLDDKDASKILYKEVKGTTIAFIGYNYYDTMLGTGAIATSTHAGSNSYSETKMKSDIETARQNADIIIVDFQFQECYSYPEHSGIYPICYKPLASPDQTGTFRKAVDFGADIVIGTQAHQPQTYEIYEGKLVFYGLGNLFFDQVYWVGTRHGLVLTHYMYEGKLLQTKITTTNYDGTMQTYVSEGDERELLLELLRDAR